MEQTQETQVASDLESNGEESIAPEKQREGVLKVFPEIRKRVSNGA